MRAVRIPADGVAAAEDGERAECFQPAGAAAELGIGAMVHADGCGRELALGGHEPRADAREPPPEVERLELALELLEPALPAP